VETALSSVREVELEADDAREAEGAISRAIETLDREARGETTSLPANDDLNVEHPLPAAEQVDSEQESDTSFAAAPAEPRAGAGLTIFLVVFALLRAGTGGAGFWAWREGYVDFDQMFGRAEPAETPVAVAPTPQSSTPTLDGVETLPPTTDQETGPGNTATATALEPTTALEGLEPSDERLAPTPEAANAAIPEAGTDELKTEERLPGEDTAIASAEDPLSSVDPEILAGSQSLLLEASDQGSTGAVPFSGTIEWSEGVDEIGLPTLQGEANIPARNLGVNLLIRKNSDPSLPASHVMEIDFDVSDTFIGGTIADLPGVLLKNQELVQGTPLAGASARIVGNSFLFALDASPDDVPANIRLLTTGQWMDLAVIYGTGKRAIITLEKDDEAVALFNKVFGAWGETASAAPAPAPAAPAN
jgi:hypothetical protein